MVALLSTKFLSGRSVSSDRERSDKDKKKVQILIIDVCIKKHIMCSFMWHTLVSLLNDVS